MEVFLRSGSETQARLRLRKKVAKAQRKNREAFAVHDPLLDAAEHLHDALSPHMRIVKTGICQLVT